jgi:hypothetical protein
VPLARRRRAACSTTLLVRPLTASSQINDTFRTRLHAVDGSRDTNWATKTGDSVTEGARNGHVGLHSVERDHYGVFAPRGKAPRPAGE